MLKFVHAVQSKNPSSGSTTNFNSSNKIQENYDADEGDHGDGDGDD